MNHHKPVEDFESSSVPTPGPGTTWPEKVRRLTIEPTHAALSSPLRATRRPGLDTTDLALGFLLLQPPISDSSFVHWILVSFSPPFLFSVKVVTAR